MDYIIDNGRCSGDGRININNEDIVALDEEDCLESHIPPPTPGFDAEQCANGRSVSYYANLVCVEGEDILYRCDTKVDITRIIDPVCVDPEVEQRTRRLAFLRGFRD